MSASIGQYTFTSWQGRMLRARRNTAVIPGRPGTSVNGVVYGGWISPPSRIRTSTLLTGDVLTGEITGDLYRAMIGTTQDVTDPQGLTWTDVRVVDVTYEVDDTVISSQVRLTAQWVLLTRSISPPGAA